MSSAGATLRRSIVVPEIESKSDETTVEDLVRTHAQTVFRVAYSVLRNHADAEDVSQETFLRAMKHGKLGRIENHKAWLVKIAWRLAVDRAKRLPLDPIDDVLEKLRSGESSLEDVVNEQQRVRLLHHLLQTLPADLREPMILSTVQEMSSAEVSEVLGIPDSSVRNRLLRGREMLRQKLAAKLGGKYDKP